MFRRKRARSASLTATARSCARPNPTDPEVISRFVAATGLPTERIGLESSCTAAWLFAGLQRHGWPVVCIDARHAGAALQAGFRNKNDPYRGARLYHAADPANRLVAAELETR